MFCYYMQIGGPLEGWFFRFKVQITTAGHWDNVLQEALLHCPSAEQWVIGKEPLSHVIHG